MRAVTGSVVSSEPISLRRAAGILSKFSSAETGARPEAAAYLRRASKAFDELVQFHREIRGSHKGTGIQIQDEERGENYKKRKKKEGAGLEDGGGGIPVQMEEAGNPRRRPEEEFIPRQEEERRNSRVGVEGGGANGEVHGIEENWDRKREKMMKMKKAEEAAVGKGSLERNNKKGKKRNIDAEEVRRHSDKGKISQVEEGGGLDDWSEHHNHKKKRRIKN